jgi:ATP-dependent RNA helicase DDX24/MAK5
MLPTTKTKSFNSRYSYIWNNADVQVIDKTQPAPRPRPGKKATKSLKGDLINEEFTGFAEGSEDEAKDMEGSVDGNPFENLDTIQEDIDLPEWSKMRLSDATLQALQSLGFTAPTPIQSLAIPRIMQGHDLIGKASTGSGKTLAFGIPILEHILSLPEQKSPLPSAIVIAPTRELAKQIVVHLEALAKFSLGAMTVVNITGGLAVQKQIRILEKRPSVIVGTPGRLWEVLNSPELKALQLDVTMKKIQFLVLDEADRLLQEGHFKEIEQILEFMNGGADKQTLVFSATFQKQLQQKLKRKQKFEENILSKDDALGRSHLDVPNILEFLLKKLQFREQPPRFVDANPGTAVTKQVHEGIIECANLEKVTSTLT